MLGNITNHVLVCPALQQTNLDASPVDDSVSVYGQLWLQYADSSPFA